MYSNLQLVHHALSDASDIVVPESIPNTRNYGESRGHRILCYTFHTTKHTTTMHLTEAIRTQKGPFHTYEFFPPRTEAGLVNLLDRIRRLAAKPLPAPIAVSVTWGAGGATADRSLELAEHVVKMGLEVILHLTCTNMPKARVDEALEVSQ
jgi:hypothetical protein